MDLPWILLGIVPTPPDPQMTGSSWLLLGGAWLFVSALLVWSFVRVLGGGKRQP